MLVANRSSLPPATRSGIVLFLEPLRPLTRDVASAMSRRRRRSVPPTPPPVGAHSSSIMGNRFGRGTRRCHAKSSGHGDGL
jgi:hypothetical protein